MPYFGQEIMEMAEKKGPLTSAGVQGGAREEPPAGAHAGHRRGDDEAPARCAGRADRRPGVADRSRQRRRGTGRLPRAVIGRRGRRLSAHHRAGGLSTAACRWASRSSARAWSEPTLIKLAYAYEQATRHRRPPSFAPTADLAQLITILTRPGAVTSTCRVRAAANVCNACKQTHSSGSPWSGTLVA